MRLNTNLINYVINIINSGMKNKLQSWLCIDKFNEEETYMRRKFEDLEKDVNQARAEYISLVKIK